MSARGARQNAVAEGGERRTAPITHEWKRDLELFGSLARVGPAAPADSAEQGDRQRLPKSGRLPRLHRRDPCVLNPSKIPQGEDTMQRPKPV